MFKSVGFNKSKSQIIVSHTSREAKEYLVSLQFRYNNKYDKIPNYLIDREGNVTCLLDSDAYSNYFGNSDIDFKSVNIVLENLGWLEKIPLTNRYINWKGDIYIGDVYEKKWRDYIYWHPYTDEQILSLFEVTKTLLNKYSIPDNIVDTNVKIFGVENINGVVSRSNYNQINTDVNPSFDFKKFAKLFKNEYK